LNNYRLESGARVTQTNNIYIYIYIYIYTHTEVGPTHALCIGNLEAEFV
jgi:hypothetical protein